jgi:HAD superfamily hydrolase (TIGR01490 family)
MHFVRACYRAGMIGPRRLAAWGWDHLRFRLRGSTDEGTRRALRQAEDVLRGVPGKQIERMAPELLAGILPRIYAQMIDEVRAHQDAGRATFIVSAAGDGVVRLLAEVLGMEGGIGTRYEVDPDGVMTGRLDGPLVYGAGKVEAIRRFAAEHDLDLERSWAYTDSASDMPMLRAVGNPIAVNPDAELAGVAGEEGWQVMRFEKLGRRLTIAGTTVAAAAIGGMGTALASRRGPRRRAARLRPGRLTGSRGRRI